MPPPVEPAALRPLLDCVLRAWRTAFGWPSIDVPPHALGISGADLRLEVAGPEGSRVVRGRLSAFGLLCGRFWAAAALDAEAYRLCPAWLLTLAEMPADGPGLGALLHQRAFTAALRDAGLLFEAAGEIDEAALCISRSSAAGVPVRLDRLSAAMRARLVLAFVPPSETALPKGLKHADPVCRLAAIRAAESALHALGNVDLLEAIRPFRSRFQALLGDVQPALHERALALAEVWSRKLWRRRAYRETLGLLDVLEDANIAIGDTLRLRYEARLAVGDIAGARNDWARLTSLGARVRVSEGAALPDDFARWRAAALARVAEAHLEWAAGGDPCPDRPGRTRVSPTTRQRHLAAARSRFDEAIAIFEDAGSAEARLARARPRRR